jgi:hypothetical protein
MDEVCNTHGKDEKCTQNFFSETLKGKDHLDDQGVIIYLFI